MVLIGNNSSQELKVYSKATFNALATLTNGLTVNGGAVSFPNASIPASCISGLINSSGSTGPQGPTGPVGPPGPIGPAGSSTNLTLSSNIWSEGNVFQKEVNFHSGLSVVGNTNLDNLYADYGNFSEGITISNGGISITGGLTLISGTIDLPDKSISSNCINFISYNLPSLVMVPPSLNQIGYITDSNSIEVITINSNVGKTLSTIKLDPIGSIWEVRSQVILKSTQPITELYFGIFTTDNQTGTIYNKNYNPCFTQVFSSTSYPANTNWNLNSSGIYSVDKNYINIGAYITSNGSITTSSIYLQATRIA